MSRCDRRDLGRRRAAGSRRSGQRSIGSSPTAALLRGAGDLAEEHGLRAYDAVHLASLEQIADAETVLVAADGDLPAAARARGFTTAQLG